jgi:hypothetical protein
MKKPMNSDPTYPPLDTLKPVAAGIWIFDSGPLRLLGLAIPVRMTVIQLASSGLILHSATRFTPELKDALDPIGPVEHMVAPNSAHWTFIKQWQAHFPTAQTWAAPGLRQRSQVRRSGVRLDHRLGAQAPEVWSGEIEQVIVPGLGGFAEVALFHKASRTLVLTDLVQNFEAEKLPRLVRPAAHLLGVTAPVGKAPAYLRTIVKLKGQEACQAAQRLVALQPERVIFSHGRWFERDGANRLRQSLSWLL